MFIIATIIDDGRLVLTDGSDTLKLACERIYWDFRMEPRTMHWEGGINLSIPILKQYLIVIAQGIWLNTHQKYSDFADYLKDWVNAGTFTLSIERDSTPNLIELDGDNTTYTVTLKKGFSGAEKRSNGDQQYYYIKKCVFEQAG